jgi:succinyl-diaminopimelate desuccinylase
MQTLTVKRTYRNRMGKNLFKKIDSYTGYAIKLQENLTKIPAISPVNEGEGEYDKAQYLLSELKKLKFDTIKVINAPDKRAKKGVRPNIIARYRGKNSSKTLWIMSHIDIVPAGDEKSWKTPPYKAIRKGDKIYGRGVQDDQQGMISGLLAVKSLMDANIRPPVDIALLFVSDEEQGNALGIDYILKKHRNIFGKNDIFIVPDAGVPSGKKIIVAEKSVLWLKFIVMGKAAHAGYPHHGINSLKATAALISDLEALYKKFGKKNKIYEPHSSTFEATKIEQNVANINSIPAKTVFYADCRVLPQYQLSEVEKEIQKIAKKVQTRLKVKTKVETIGTWQSENPTPANAEIVKLLKNAIYKVHKVKPKAEGIGGKTVAFSLRKAGFEAAVYFKNDQMDHLSNEYCKISNMIGDAKVFASVAINAIP